MLRAANLLLAVSVAAMLALTFVWPLAVSADPAHPEFKGAAIVTFILFFAALSALLVLRLARRR